MNQDILVENAKYKLGKNPNKLLTMNQKSLHLKEFIDEKKNKPDLEENEIEIIIESDSSDEEFDVNEDESEEGAKVDIIKRNINLLFNDAESNIMDFPSLPPTKSKITKVDVASFIKNLSADIEKEKENNPEKLVENMKNVEFNEEKEKQKKLRRIYLDNANKVFIRKIGAGLISITLTIPILLLSSKSELLQYSSGISSLRNFDIYKAFEDISKVTDLSLTNLLFSPFSFVTDVLNIPNHLLKVYDTAVQINIVVEDFMLNVEKTYEQDGVDGIRKYILSLTLKHVVGVISKNGLPIGLLPIGFIKIPIVQNLVNCGIASLVNKKGGGIREKAIILDEFLKTNPQLLDPFNKGLFGRSTSAYEYLFNSVTGINPEDCNQRIGFFLEKKIKTYVEFYEPEMTEDEKIMKEHEEEMEKQKKRQEFIDKYKNSEVALYELDIENTSNMDINFNKNINFLERNYLQSFRDGNISEEEYSQKMSNLKTKKKEFVKNRKDTLKQSLKSNKITREKFDTEVRQLELTSNYYNSIKLSQEFNFKTTFNENIYVKTVIDSLKEVAYIAIYMGFDSYYKNGIKASNEEAKKKNLEIKNNKKLKRAEKQALYKKNRNDLIDTNKKIVKIYGAFRLFNTFYMGGRSKDLKATKLMRFLQDPLQHVNFLTDVINPFINKLIQEFEIQEKVVKYSMYSIIAVGKCFKYLSEWLSKQSYDIYEFIKRGEWPKSKDIKWSTEDYDVIINNFTVGELARYMLDSSLFPSKLIYLLLGKGNSSKGEDVFNHYIYERMIPRLDQLLLSHLVNGLTGNFINKQIYGINQKILDGINSASELLGQISYNKGKILFNTPKDIDNLVLNKHVGRLIEDKIGEIGLDKDGNYNKDKLMEFFTDMEDTFKKNIDSYDVNDKKKFMKEFGPIMKVLKSEDTNEQNFKKNIGFLNKLFQKRLKSFDTSAIEVSGTKDLHNIIEKYYTSKKGYDVGESLNILYNASKDILYTELKEGIMYLKDIPNTVMHDLFQKCNSIYNFNPVDYLSGKLNKLLETNKLFFNWIFSQEKLDWNSVIKEQEKIKQDMIKSRIEALRKAKGDKKDENYIRLNYRINRQDKLIEKYKLQKNSYNQLFDKKDDSKFNKFSFFFNSLYTKMFTFPENWEAQLKSPYIAKFMKRLTLKETNYEDTFGSKTDIFYKSYDRYLYYKSNPEEQKDLTDEEKTLFTNFDMALSTNGTDTKFKNSIDYLISHRTEIERLNLVPIKSLDDFQRFLDEVSDNVETVFSSNDFNDFTDHFFGIDLNSENLKKLGKPLTSMQSRLSGIINVLQNNDNVDLMGFADLMDGVKINLCDSEMCLNKCDNFCQGDNKEEQFQNMLSFIQQNLEDKLNYDTDKYSSFEEYVEDLNKQGKGQEIKDLLNSFKELTELTEPDVMNNLLFRLNYYYFSLGIKPEDGEELLNKDNYVTLEKLESKLSEYESLVARKRQYDKTSPVFNDDVFESKIQFYKSKIAYFKEYLPEIIDTEFDLSEFITDENSIFLSIMFDINSLSKDTVEDFLTGFRTQIDSSSSDFIDTQRDLSEELEVGDTQTPAFSSLMTVKEDIDNQYRDLSDYSIKTNADPYDDIHYLQSRNSAIDSDIGTFKQKVDLFTQKRGEVKGFLIKYDLKDVNLKLSDEDKTEMEDLLRDYSDYFTPLEKSHYNLIIEGDGNRVDLMTDLQSIVGDKKLSLLERVDKIQDNLLDKKLNVKTFTITNAQREYLKQYVKSKQKLLVMSHYHNEYNRINSLAEGNTKFETSHNYLSKTHQDSLKSFMTEIKSGGYSEFFSQYEISLYKSKNLAQSRDATIYIQKHGLISQIEDTEGEIKGLDTSYTGLKVEGRSIVLGNIDSFSVIDLNEFLETVQTKLSSTKQENNRLKGDLRTLIESNKKFYTGQVLDLSGKSNQELQTLIQTTTDNIKSNLKSKVNFYNEPKYFKFIEDTKFNDLDSKNIQELTDTLNEIESDLKESIKGEINEKISKYESIFTEFDSEFLKELTQGKNIEELLNDKDINGLITLSELLDTKLNSIKGNIEGQINFELENLRQRTNSFSYSVLGIDETEYSNLEQKDVLSLNTLLKNLDEKIEKNEEYKLRLKKMGIVNLINNLVENNQEFLTEEQRAQFTTNLNTKSINELERVYTNVRKEATKSIKEIIDSYNQQYNDVQGYIKIDTKGKTLEQLKQHKSTLEPIIIDHMKTNIEELQSNYDDLKGFTIEDLSDKSISDLVSYEEALVTHIKGSVVGKINSLKSINSKEKYGTEKISFSSKNVEDMSIDELKTEFKSINTQLKKKLSDNIISLIEKHQIYVAKYGITNTADRTHLFSLSPDKLESITSRVEDRIRSQYIHEITVLAHLKPEGFVINTEEKDLNNLKSQLEELKSRVLSDLKTNINSLKGDIATININDNDFDLLNLDGYTINQLESIKLAVEVERGRLDEESKIEEERMRRIEEERKKREEEERRIEQAERNRIEEAGRLSTNINELISKNSDKLAGFEQKDIKQMTNDELRRYLQELNTHIAAVKNDTTVTDDTTVIDTDTVATLKQTITELISQNDEKLRDFTKQNIDQMTIDQLRNYLDEINAHLLTVKNDTKVNNDTHINEHFNFNVNVNLGAHPQLNNITNNIKDNTDNSTDIQVRVNLKRDSMLHLLSQLTEDQLECLIQFMNALSSSGSTGLDPKKVIEQVRLYNSGGLEYGGDGNFKGNNDLKKYYKDGNNLNDMNGVKGLVDIWWRRHFGENTIKNLELTEEQMKHTRFKKGDYDDEDFYKSLELGSGSKYSVTTEKSSKIDLGIGAAIALGTAKTVILTGIAIAQGSAAAAVVATAGGYLAVGFAAYKTTKALGTATFVDEYGDYKNNGYSYYVDDSRIYDYTFEMSDGIKKNEKIDVKDTFELCRRDKKKIYIRGVPTVKEDSDDINRMDYWQYPQSVKDAATKQCQFVFYGNTKVSGFFSRFSNSLVGTGLSEYTECLRTSIQEFKDKYDTEVRSKLKCDSSDGTEESRREHNINIFKKFILDINSDIDAYEDGVKSLSTNSKQTGGFGISRGGFLKGSGNVGRRGENDEFVLPAWISEIIGERKLSELAADELDHLKAEFERKTVDIATNGVENAGDAIDWLAHWGYTINYLYDGGKSLNDLLNHQQVEAFKEVVKKVSVLKSEQWVALRPSLHHRALRTLEAFKERGYDIVDKERGYMRRIYEKVKVTETVKVMEDKDWTQIAGEAIDVLSAVATVTRIFLPQATMNAASSSILLSVRLSKDWCEETDTNKKRKLLDSARETIGSFNNVYGSNIGQNLGGNVKTSRNWLNGHYNKVNSNVDSATYNVIHGVHAADNYKEAFNELS